MKQFKNIYSVAVLALLMPFAASTLVSCEDSHDIKTKTWTLTWEDNFEGQAGDLPDATKWTYDIGNSGWGNNELQYYTNRPENVSLDGEGNLAIVAKKESFEGSYFTSARIKTQGLFSQQYGRFEARIKLPYGQGIWPAFWMLGDDIATNPWPACGEIDIMEYKGQQPSLIHGSVHGPGYSGGNPVTQTWGLRNDRFDDAFHIFAIEWGPEYIYFFVDDVCYQEINPADCDGEWVYNDEFFMILNVAVGGDYVGWPSDTNTDFPQTMLIDYVRVYK